jgi:NAD dependent epimerase/dehydratase
VSDWAGVNVLVTGGEGFIGSHLTEALVAAGANVRVLSYYTSFGGTGWLDASIAEVMPGDVRDAGRVREAVDGRDVVFHLAALIGIPYSYVAPESYIQTNVTGSFNVADACRRAGVKRMVHTSTSETYGTARTVPISEDHPLQPQSPYSASKIGGDMMVLSLHHAFELPVAVARPFNTYGPRQSTRAVIPTILSQLIGGATEVKLGALTPTRDFNYATDTAAGMMAIALADKCVGSVTNIGSGEEISIGDLAQLLIEATGVDAKVVLDESRVRPGGSEVDRLLADNTKLRELTGWSPQVPLRDGLARTADWIRDHLADLETGNYSV